MYGNLRCPLHLLIHAAQYGKMWFSCGCMGVYRTLNAANLGGELGNDLGMFTSIKEM